MKSNPVVWFEIYVQDMARAKQFYETVLQTQLQALATPAGSASNAGMQMMAFPSEMNAAGAAGALVKMAGIPSGAGGSLIYFSCDDCGVEQARVEAAGGRIHAPKFAIGEYGHCALVIDTEGNCIGLHSMN